VKFDFCPLYRNGRANPSASPAAAPGMGILSSIYAGLINNGEKLSPVIEAKLALPCLPKMARIICHFWLTCHFCQSNCGLGR
jgi:hypothetical protein